MAASEITRDPRTRRRLADGRPDPSVSPSPTTAAIGAYRIADATGEAWGHDRWTPFARSRSTRLLKTRDEVPTMYAATTLPAIVAGLDAPVGADLFLFPSLRN